MSPTTRLLNLAQAWACQAGSPLQFWPLDGTGVVPILDMNATDAALLSCALDLRSALRLESDFWQALRDLGLEPVEQDGKCPGG